ncbi:hypothetical protein [Burkholderia vietnamiensis]|uniref:hypothetical protein n=1 Tax=Burkholderia vietnamiensis TaxID=60552 RepID=UPI001B91C89E|nr:hypothetical protein [Burkholderia vietnamiensis]MBR8006557.1 hypothetical protein [Burkholderia vietnamiensis]MDN7814695.1 hypothetical protein [Burkholderia vietnamiensis]MDN8042358.1 hypothetical protein [Burkholderia vietnamiensis]HDR9131343.1 hypothetical protein [Burkholderia vietnamiensis]
MTTKYTGHLPNSGGLQGHSIGESYPFAVVGCQVAKLGDHEATSKETRYYVLDCSTGKRYVRHDGSTFYSAALAHKFAAACKIEGVEDWAAV